MQAGHDRPQFGRDMRQVRRRKLNGAAECHAAVYAQLWDAAWSARGLTDEVVVFGIHDLDGRAERTPERRESHWSASTKGRRRSSTR